MEWGRFKWISQELTSHLRGHKELKNFDTPEFEEDGSKAWKPLMECLQKRIYQCREWEVLLVIKNSEDERFELKLVSFRKHFRMWQKFGMCKSMQVIAS